MDDFFKFLLIAGAILVGVFKEVNKNSKSKKAKDSHPIPPIPSPIEVAPDTTPIPDIWDRPKSLDELFNPKPIERPTSKQSSKQKIAKQKNKKEEVSIAASLANSAAQDERNSLQGTHYDIPREASSHEEDFTIHSAEEARRAIIWGEILQRKY